MRSLSWTSDRADDLAAKWCVTISAVKRYAAEASQLVQEDVRQDPEMRALSAAALRKIVEDCDTVARIYGPSAKGKRRTEHPHVVVAALRTKIEAVRAMTQLMGLNMPEQHEVHHINEALEREHEQLFELLRERLPEDVFAAVLQAVAGDEPQRPGLRGSGPAPTGAASDPLN